MGVDSLWILDFARWDVIRRRFKYEKLGTEEEVEKSFASWFWEGEFKRANEYHGRALGNYTRMVTCPCNFWREAIESFGEQIEGK